MNRTIRYSVIGLLVLILFGNTLWKWGLDLWEDANYSHGLLMPLIAGYVIRQRWRKLREAIDEPAILGLVFVIAALILFCLGYVAGELFSKRISFIILLYGLILFLEGKQIASLLRFPVGLMLFAVPLPYILYDAVAFPLKLSASQIAVFMLQLFGMPAFRDGNVIALAHTNLEVVDACSGIRSLMTLISLAFLLGYFQHQSLWKRSIIVLLATPIAVIANAVRITITGILTAYDPAWNEGFRHELAGWLVFVGSFALLAGISWLFGQKKEEEA